MEDVEKIAKAFHNPPEMYGLVWRGLKNANAIGYTWALRSYGGNEVRTISRTWLRPKRLRRWTGTPVC